MKRVFRAYWDILGVMFLEAPVMVVSALVGIVGMGALVPFGIFVNQNVFDGGLAVARGELAFADYQIFLVMLVGVLLLPEILRMFISVYVDQRSQLVLRTAYRERILKKLKKMKYEHFENEGSMEIIDKAFNRVNQAIWHLWPSYVHLFLSATVASIGTLAFLASVRWWLVLTAIVPFVLELRFAGQTSMGIYKEMETYWGKERKYGLLGGFLRSRAFVKELKAFGNSEFLIDTYEKRLNERNREYESFFFKNLRRILMNGNITRIGAIGNAVILLVLFANGEISVGMFIALTQVVLTVLYNFNGLSGISFIFQAAPHHVNTFEFYDKFLNLSDESEGVSGELPSEFDIEFRDVWFRYPGTERDILQGLSFKVRSGERASIVGENGEGKSTAIKLLLGLFSPDKGEILVGGRNLDDYPLSVRTKIFGPVFQDFTRYSITLGENIGIGNVDESQNDGKIRTAAAKGKALEFSEKLEKGFDTLLGRDFEGGTDLSGGQWQRIAISRAFMGDKPILLLDEPTSQLDPMAEADLYHEFADMVENKTALFITHRLGSTLITDKIFVIHGGKITESGTHADLMSSDGLYSQMFNAQKQWYLQEG
ncbi:MAG: ABC transporter ATP-binding protein/permease [Turicibacter sp.]|nr:ABC transporter ATP-binding protein/permease [Turicibacter sp.]